MLHASDSFCPDCQTRLSFDKRDLKIEDQAIYIFLGDHWIQTNTIRVDEEGMYICGEDVLGYGIPKGLEKQWKCPYCFYWWKIGEKCKNPDCPTNLW